MGAAEAAAEENVSAEIEGVYRQSLGKLARLKISATLHLFEGKPEMDFLELVREKARIKLLFLPHAVRQMSRVDRKLTVDDVKTVIAAGSLIEEYPEDVRGHSGLLLGLSHNGRPVHVVCSPKSGYLAVITAYIPDEKSWVIDFRTRTKL